MNLIRTSLLSFIATMTKLVSGMVINKVVAVYAGPSGLALIGQFQSLVQILMSFSQGGVNQGVIKYTAEKKDDTEQLTLYSSASLRITLFSSVLVSVFCIIFASMLSEVVFGEDSYVTLIRVFGAMVLLYAVNQWYLCTLNGRGLIGDFIKVQIIQNIFMLFFCTVMVVNFETLGALYALAIGQSMVLIYLIVLRGVDFFNSLKSLVITPSNTLYIKFFKFSLMTLTTAAVVPLVQIQIRNIIGDQLGNDSVGYWQGVWYISTMYLLVLTTVLSTYLLPKLSSIQEVEKLDSELIRIVKLLIPVSILFAAFIFTIKSLLVSFLFDGSFQGMLPLFKWQLIGDVVKIASWVFSYIMLAKSMTKAYIYSEVFFGFLLLTLSHVLLNSHGLEGITLAYLINNIFYFVFACYNYMRWRNKIEIGSVS
ncbi:O-antigen translocase [Vibrio campbellii]|uniref:O-antigen translocase n=1 Tax=Vibrio campbellii TaxID=680 RepID=UPI00215CE29E|nr:O-antigen translocase [Vibrio campbellii]MCR9908108.1 O-antigen translocase [Vibrio campbellii]